MFLHGAFSRSTQSSGNSGNGFRRGRVTRFETLECRQLLSVASAQDEVPAVEGEVSMYALDAGEQSLAFPNFASAEDLEQYLVNDALDRYRDLFGMRSGWGWCGDYRIVSFDAVTFASAPDHSDTNTQVYGVDEGDLIETDGNWLYVLAENQLAIVNAWPAEELSVASRTPIEGRPVAEYLYGDRLTVISDTWGDILPMMAGVGWWPGISYEPKTTVTVFDVSDRNSPRVIQSTEMEGSLVDSRAVGDHVYLVLNHEFILPGPQLLPTDEIPVDLPVVVDPIVVDPIGVDPIVSIDDMPFTVASSGRLTMPAWYGSGFVYESEEQYLARISGQVFELAMSDYSSVGADGQVLESGFLTEAVDVYQPLGGDPTNLVSVIVFDAASDDPGPASSVGVPAGYVSQIYASQSSLYLLDQVWTDGGTATNVLKLDRDATGGEFVLTARGQVPGNVLNQFSIDEYNGDLRIATTTGWSVQNAGPESGVYVLRQQGDELVTIGQVDGLAAGEQIYAVRFLDDFALVVTFLRTDPLWTIDLSNPESPQVVGELEIPGFSNYLHLLPDGYLIGIGQDADPETGRAEEPQVSLFDVADPANPQLLDRFNMETSGWAWSEAFSDHHAVAYYPEYGVLTFSVTSGGAWDEAGYRPPTTELFVFRIDTTADATGAARHGEIELLGRVEHDQPIRRTARIENVLYSVSADTVSAHDILRPETEIARVYFGDNLIDLGEVDSERLEGGDFADTDPWYTFETTLDGVLTVEVPATVGPGVTLTLYDDEFQPVATAADLDGTPRLDIQADEGETYYLRVSQLPGGIFEEAPFSLVVSNVVRKVGKNWTVSGTDGDDRFVLNPAALSVNGVRYPFKLGTVASIAFEGGAGNDNYDLAGKNIAVTIVDRAGVDQLDFSRAVAALDLNLANPAPQQIGAGNVSLTLRGIVENAVGTKFADTIRGNAADNRIDVRAGNDLVYGGRGNDRLLGGTGNDRLFGELGNDLLDGGAGDDDLDGGAAMDLLSGGFGRNTLNAGAGNDLVLSKGGPWPTLDVLDHAFAAWTNGSDARTRGDRIRQLFVPFSVTYVAEGLNLASPTAAPLPYAFPTPAPAKRWNWRR